MNLLRTLPFAETLQAVPDFAAACYAFYGVLGFDWTGDRFDMAFALLIALAVSPRLWRDGCELHERLVVRPREHAAAAQRQARHYRRALPQANIKGGQRGR